MALVVVMVAAVVVILILLAIEFHKREYLTFRCTKLSHQFLEKCNFNIKYETLSTLLFKTAFGLC